jgi:hypothetical protein
MIACNMKKAIKWGGLLAEDFAFFLLSSPTVSCSKPSLFHFPPSPIFLSTHHFRFSLSPPSPILHTGGGHFQFFIETEKIGFKREGCFSTVALVFSGNSERLRCAKIPDALVQGKRDISAADIILFVVGALHLQQLL